MPSIIESMKSAAVVSFIAVSRYCSLGAFGTVIPLGTIYSKDKPYPSLKSYFFNPLLSGYSLRKRLLLQLLFILTGLPFIAQLIGVLMGVVAALLGSVVGGIMSLFSSTSNWFSKMGGYFVREPHLMGLPLLFDEGLVNPDLFDLLEKVNLDAFSRRIKKPLTQVSPKTLLRYSKRLPYIYSCLQRRNLLRLDVLTMFFNDNYNINPIDILRCIEAFFKEIDPSDDPTEAQFIEGLIESGRSFTSNPYLQILCIVGPRLSTKVSVEQLDIFRLFLRTATHPTVTMVGYLLSINYQDNSEKLDLTGIFLLLQFPEIAVFIYGIIILGIQEQLGENRQLVFNQLMKRLGRQLKIVLQEPDVTPYVIIFRIFTHMNEVLVQNGYQPIRFPDAKTRAFTQRQNTHTASVHESVGASLVRLRDRYSSLIDSSTKIQVYQDAILEYFENWELLYPINPSEDNANLSVNIGEFVFTSHELATAKKILRRVFDLNSEFSTTREAISDQTVYQSVVYFWLAIWDRNNWNMGVKFEDGVLSFLKTLYQIQRGYNLTDANNQYGYVDSEPEMDDRPICVGGTFNTIVSGLVGIHPDAEVIFATKETLKIRIEIVVNEYVRAEIKKINLPDNVFECMSHEKIASLLQLAKDIVSQGVDPFWHQIENDVKSQIRSEFKGVVKISQEEFEVYLDNAKFADLDWKPLNAILKPLIERLEQRMERCISNPSLQEDSDPMDDFSAAGVFP